MLKLDRVPILVNRVADTYNFYNANFIDIAISVSTSTFAATFECGGNLNFIF